MPEANLFRNFTGTHNRVNMKTESEIRELKNKINRHRNKFPGMTYEESVDDALEWVLEDMDNEESASFEAELIED